MIIESEYKGFPIIKIEVGKKKDGETDYLIVGVKKARAIVENFDAINAWVDKNDKGAWKK
jgi:hypothetical protein